MAEATVEQLRTALGQMQSLVAAVRPEQWAARTPCTDWDVRTLVSHVVAGNRHVAAALRGEQAKSDEGQDLPAAFAESVREVVEAFSTSGALERVVQVPFGTVPGAVALHLRVTEALVHGWDLAQATHQMVPFDDALAEQEAEFTATALATLPPERRPFAPPKEAPGVGSAVERLVAMLGRDPELSASG